jgi:ATP-dependent helicase/nuclease subunit A
MTEEPSHLAGDPRRSAWVSAHAGSGKTYTLANRVTRLLLERVKPERILCLTYTKTAAAEMQDRLFRQLGSWAMLPDAKLAAEVTAIGGTLNGSDALNEARRLFASALETPGGLKIQTIHAFCQNLLSRFPLEAGMPPGFRVVDEQSSRQMIVEARTRVLSRAGQGEEPLASAVAYLVTETNESRLSQLLEWAMGNERSRIERHLLHLLGNEQDFLTRLRNNHGAGAHPPQEIRDRFCSSITSETQKINALIHWLRAGTSNDQKRAELLAASLAARSDQCFDAWRRALLNSDGTIPKRIATAGRAQSDPALFEFLNELTNRMADADGNFRAARAAALATAVLRLAEATQVIYSQQKRARGLIDYNDLIMSARDLVTRADAAAWVLYKLDGGIEHILIDEAQDTSPVQWEIIKALTSEFFSVSSLEPRTVFAVGDEKQSIFSFQGAAPQEFAAHRAHFAAAASDQSAQFSAFELAVSRRSAPEILAFVDAVFAQPSARSGLTKGEQAIIHRAARTTKGRVELWPTTKPPAPGDQDPWAPIDVVRQDSPVRKLAIRIADAIAKWTDGRTYLPSHERPVSAGSIMVLMPRREPFASEIIRQLKERGIPVAGADRLRLLQQIAVKDLIALGRFVLLPEDDLNLAALLRSPLIGISEEELYSLCHARTGDVWSELMQRRQEAPAFDFAYIFLSEMRRIADVVPPYEFYATALMRHGMKRRLVARLGNDALDCIEEFVTLALDYEQINSPSLEGFLYWLERSETEVKRDMEKARDEVRVMTVHAAKGLEADIVILPDTTTLPETPGRRGELLVSDEDIIYPLSDREAPPKVKAAKDRAELRAREEHNRLLYVALTRAREQLYICGFENRGGVREGSWYWHCAAAAQLLGQEEKRGDEIFWVVGDSPLLPGPPSAEAPAVTFELPGWVKAVPPRSASAARIIRPSQTENEYGDSQSWQPNPSRFTRGLLVHTLLARLPELPVAERSKVAERFLSARGIPSEMISELTRQILAVLDAPEFASVFLPSARSEVPIVADLPDVIPGGRLSGRIDRLFVGEEDVLAVDFKTDQCVPAMMEDIPPPYVVQMALYRAALRKVFPRRRVETALVWTTGPQLMRLPGSRLDAEIARLRQRLNTIP